MVVTDCRSASRASEKFRRKAAVVAAACSQIGWDYRLVGEPDPVWAANLRWLAATGTRGSAMSTSKRCSSLFSPPRSR